MTIFLPDTSCMVAAMCSWHVQHQPVAAELERRMTRGEAMVVAAVTLVESYAVLTRLPPPHRIAPSDALALIAANFMNGVETVALGPDAYHALLRQAPTKGIAGGRSYDAVIAACASQAQAATLLTLN
ncbi:MAG: PIN domain-containing protein, partial [Gammaproteobacteria bacterium]